jgi:hypothetical protein
MEHVIVTGHDYRNHSAVLLRLLDLDVRLQDAMATFCFGSLLKCMQSYLPLR